MNWKELSSDRACYLMGYRYYRMGFKNGNFVGWEFK